MWTNLKKELPDRELRDYGRKSQKVFKAENRVLSKLSQFIPETSADDTGKAQKRGGETLNFTEPEG